MIVAIGKIILNSPRVAPLFIKTSTLIKEQALASNGILKVDIKNEGLTIFYSFTVWKNEKSMLNFVHSHTHLKAMQNADTYSNNIVFKTYKSDVIPSIEEGITKLNNGL